MLFETKNNKEQNVDQQNVYNKSLKKPEKKTLQSNDMTVDIFQIYICLRCDFCYGEKKKTSSGRIRIGFYCLVLRCVLFPDYIRMENVWQSHRSISMTYVTALNSSKKARLHVRKQCSRPVGPIVRCTGGNKEQHFICANEQKYIKHTQKTIWRISIFVEHKSTPKRACMWCECVCVSEWMCVLYTALYSTIQNGFSLRLCWMNFAC